MRFALRKSPDNPAGPLAALFGEPPRTTVKLTWCCFIRLVIVEFVHRLLVHTAFPRKGRSEGLEPCALKGARTVLRGGGAGNSASLPDWLAYR